MGISVPYVTYMYVCVDVLMCRFITCILYNIRLTLLIYTVYTILCMRRLWHRRLNMMKHGFLLWKEYSLDRALELCEDSFSHTGTDKSTTGTAYNSYTAFSNYGRTEREVGKYIEYYT